ncbi:MAG: Clp protease N-terminal domain-containing protein [Eubacteriales bacterium]
MLRFAEKVAGQQDEYISVEHLMLGLLAEGGRTVEQSAQVRCHEAGFHG